MTQHINPKGSEPHHPQFRTISSIGSEPSEWIGPGLHTHNPTPDAEKAAGDQAAGYLGPTSFSAIFRENELTSAQEVFGQQATNAIYQEYDDDAKPSPSGLCNLEAQEHIDQGIRILQRFPEKALCEKLIARYFDVCDVMLPESVVHHVHKSMWSTFGKCLNEPRNTKTDGLSAMSKELCKTAMIPLGQANSTQDWMESFSGRNLRWEIIGNLFTLFGLSVMTMADWDPLFATACDGNPCNKRQYGEAMRECAEACLCLCNDVDAINDFVVSLMSAVYCLQSFYEGDASKLNFHGKQKAWACQSKPLLTEIRFSTLEEVWRSGKVWSKTEPSMAGKLTVTVLQLHLAYTVKQIWHILQPQACRLPLWCPNFVGAFFAIFLLVTNSSRHSWVDHLL